MFKSGYFQIFTWSGRPVRLHWSAILVGLIFSRFHFEPGAWLGYVLLVLVHEVGHATVVRMAGAKPVRIDIHGLGGECHWEGDVTPIARACIAFGGVWAQLLAFIPAALLMTFAPPVDNEVLSQILTAFLYSNLYLVAVNLLPIPPLDGSKAWALFPLLFQRWRAKRQDRSDQKIIRANELSQIDIRYRDSVERRETARTKEARALVADMIANARKDAAEG